MLPRRRQLPVIARRWPPQAANDEAISRRNRFVGEIASSLSRFAGLRDSQ
jgi:hypothetical protein